jgi:hypothetical protein
MFSGVGLYYSLPVLQALLGGKKTTQAVSAPSVPRLSAEDIAGQSFAKAGAEKRGVDDKGSWGRSPFLTEEETRVEEPARADLQVKAIITGEPRSVAMVDGHTVVVGEKVGEETVSEILPDAVVLEKEGQKRVLRTSEPFIPIEVKEMKNAAQ